VAPDGTEVDLALEEAEHSEQEFQDNHDDESSGENCHYHGTVL
jgi:hypothetical protein